MFNCQNKLNGMEISKELKCDIELSQNQLKCAIRNHQNCLSKLKADPYNVDLQKEVNQAEEQIIIIGLEQKNVIEKLREEYKAYQKSLKSNIIKNGIEERRFNLTNALNRARKQNIAITRSASATSFSDESIENVSLHSSPEHHQNPVEPHDVSQSEFLTYFSLATHEVYKEMQNKRAERKRRSTANPHFLYGNKGWDFLTNNKRKRNAFLISPISPPHTRQSVRRKQERISPPPSTHSGLKSETNVIKPIFNSFPTIPNLPSGLIIERVSPGSSSPDSRACITCKQPGALSICEVCSNGFHISCHNRPLAQTPRQCPRCISKETKTVGSLNVPSGMSVSYVTPSEVSG
ncbi:PHD finger protein 21A-like isoform X2 [Anoplophora glabripennis]|uniref:PHD finger protein 21A-like isoform X2 n=1 Tax=Anoplophora glabripennis TaxID=217634 RepID=UPI000873907D|nr:PHD finger protein 21A-like isoform X2 [Anoplophora glabripennis]